jgi:hypothetical protein
MAPGRGRLPGGTGRSRHGLGGGDGVKREIGSLMGVFTAAIPMDCSWILE